MEHEISFGNSNRENGTTFLDFPLFLRIFQWDEPTTRVPFTAEPEIPEILSKWKAPFEYYEFPKRNQKKAKGQRKKISSYTLWVPFVSRKVMFGKKSARHKTIFQRGAESSEESSGDDTCGLNLLLNQEPFVDLVLAIDAGVKSFREFFDDNDNSNSSFNQPSIVVKSSGESSDDGNESSNSSSFGNKESPVAMSDLDSECEISHEGHDDIQHDCSNADLQSGVWSDESSSVTSGDASCDQENDVEEDSDSPGELDQNAALPLYEGRVDRPTYTGSDVPAQDMFDNQFAKAPVPSAPPTDMFAQYSGYENTRFGSSFVPPPPPYVPPPSSEMPEQLFQQSTAISDDQARDAMLQFVSEHCCYGKTPAQEMVIKDIVPSSAYHYSLASFCESRKTEWQYEPYRGQPIDSPVNGPAPLPWNIPAQPQQMFSDFQTKLEVPHTANIKPCHDCLAVGYKRCYKCCGRGRLRCSRCQGSGFVQEGMEQVQCNTCFARGWKMCDVCNGHGRVKCWTCMGNAQLKTFIELTVKWENKVSHHVVGRTEQLPSELIVNSQGTEIFSQELPRVWPISTFFDQQVNMGSKRLVEEHSNKWPAKRILMQRHVLRAVPVSEVHYQWNEFSSRFWVFGHDHKVYAPDYPQKCCCGCSIL